VCVFVNDQVNGAVIAQLHSLGVRLIALRCAGYNNVDLAAATKRGVTVVRVPAYSPYAVAEHTIALMLALNRKLHRAYNRVREGNFSIDGLLGFDMHGKDSWRDRHWTNRNRGGANPNRIGLPNSGVRSNSERNLSFS